MMYFLFEEAGRVILKQWDLWEGFAKIFYNTIG